jgi:hypothetical protein
MAYFLAVHIPDAFDDLCEQLPGIVFVKIPVLLESAEKLATLAETASIFAYSCTR